MIDMVMVGNYIQKYIPRRTDISSVKQQRQKYTAITFMLYAELSLLSNIEVHYMFKLLLLLTCLWS